MVQYFGVVCFSLASHCKTLWLESRTRMCMHVCEVEAEGRGWEGRGGEGEGERWRRGEGNKGGKWRRGENVISVHVLC